MNVNGFVAFWFGVLSFFAPCVLPLVPSFLIYISGCSIQTCSDLSDKKVRRKVLLHAIAFIVGFSVVFISLGVSSSYLGNVFSQYQKWIMRVGGLLLIIMGFNMMGVLKIPFLNQEKLVHLNERPAGFFRSFIVGVTFSLGWTPCIGPVLASILLIASAGGSPFAGVRLLALYSLGLAVPFFVAALLVSRLMGFMQRFGRIVRYISPVLGGLLIVIGILLLSGYWRVINSMLET
jgi:cytochrome c-type biogenesis protein